MCKAIFFLPQFRHWYLKKKEEEVLFESIKPAKRQGLFSQDPTSIFALRCKFKNDKKKGKSGIRVDVIIARACTHVHLSLGNDSISSKSSAIIFAKELQRCKQKKKKTSWERRAWQPRLVRRNRPSRLRDTCFWTRRNPFFCSFLKPRRDWS